MQGFSNKEKNIVLGAHCSTVSEGTQDLWKIDLHNFLKKPKSKVPDLQFAAAAFIEYSVIFNIESYKNARNASSSGKTWSQT